MSDFQQILTYGWIMGIAYLLMLGWMILIGLHVIRPASRDQTGKLLWVLCLLTFGAALLQGNLAEMQLHGMVVRTYGAMDPVQYSHSIYLSKASSVLLAACAMVEALLTGWAALLVKPAVGR